MKLFTSILFAAVALVSADVSHLQNKYLAPHHAAASHAHEHHEFAPTSYDTSFQSAASDNAGFSAAIDSSAPEGAASANSFQSAEHEAPALNSFQASFTVPEGAASVAHFKSVLPAPAFRPFDAESSYSASEEGAASFVAPQTTSLSSEPAAYQASPTLHQPLHESSYSAPLGLASEVDTHYATDGGYVY